MNIQIDDAPLPNKWIKDYRGQRFNRLTVIAFERVRPRGGAVWRCRCDCGNETTTTAHDMRVGHTQSCGCQGRERSAAARRTHGMTGTPVYKIWKGIRVRCYNPNSAIYPHYGGRGIVMCDRWRESFEAFFADMGERPPGHSVERIDNDGPYSPENCEWAAKVTQMNNMRSNHCITYQGKTQSLADWARELGIDYHRLRARIERGVPVERAFSAERLQRKASGFYDDIGQTRHPRSR